ncbi:P-II family nitrogen regulator [Bacillus solimangrovi]|uniref:Transcriptional regulator n=1 Tax=Bacillus solimangrovi TaxID=1305675 RepID=A0A1E5LC68_9BACI|nr:P-II family nitrogen regulator [Bacillus solimangrovi]OEH91661.1 transcriptional regulator [Bacillus solimangrovi]
MKKVEAIIRPEQFQALRSKLEQIGIHGLTVSEVAGCGKQKGKEGIFRGNRFEINLYPKVKVEMIIEEQQVNNIVESIQLTCSTGEVGDGKIFIYPVENVIRIRTGEHGYKALI